MFLAASSVIIKCGRGRTTHRTKEEPEASSQKSEVTARPPRPRMRAAMPRSQQSQPDEPAALVPAVQLVQQSMMMWPQGVMSNAHANTCNTALLFSPLSWDVLLTASTQLMAADGLAVSIRTALPFQLVRRALHRMVRWYGRRWRSICNGNNDAGDFGYGTSSDSRHRRKKRTRPRSMMGATATIRGPPRGLRNHGQTCFLNSVLQALASSQPFLRYLEDVVERSWRLHELRYRLDDDDAIDDDVVDDDDDDEQSVSELVRDILSYINGVDVIIQQQQIASLKVKELLQRVGKVHVQFRPRSGGGLAHVGTEQQDAQELLQALVGMIEAESALTEPALTVGYGDVRDESSTIISVVSACQSDIGSRECNNRLAPDEKEDVVRSSNQMLENGGDVLTLSDWLRRVDEVQREMDESVARKTSCEPQIGAGEVSGPSSPLSQREEKKSEEDEILSIGLQDATSLLRQNKPQRLDSTTKDNVGTKTSVSPLTGWTGSVLQCLRCNHVRPLTNTQFLEIPIIPTAIGVPGMNPSSPLPACSLYDCLHDFSKSERVTNVECQSCSVGAELSSIEDEIMLLKGAIDSVTKRSGKAEKAGAEGLVGELHDLEMRRHFLRSADLDQDDISLKGQDQGVLCIEAEESNLVLPPPTRGPAKKCIIMSRPPAVLCFHIQRRYYDAMTDRMVKSLQIVAFPQIIDIAPFCAYASRNTSMIYKLMSVIEHRGSAHGGHYVTYRRNESGDSKWVIVSDDHVAAISWDEVRRSQAYMLIYEAV